MVYGHIRNFFINYVLCYAVIFVSIVYIVQYTWLPHWLLVIICINVTGLLLTIDYTHTTSGLNDFCTDLKHSMYNLCTNIIAVQTSAVICAFQPVFNILERLELSPVLTLSQQIILATKLGNLTALENLLDRAVKENLDDAANLKDAGEFALLHWAALNDDVPIIDCLINRGANVRLKNGRGEEPLAWAALRGHRRASTALLRHGASEDSVDDRGYSVMHHAAQNNHVHLLEYYHRRGCDVDCPDSKGRAPIHWACYMNHERTAEWLIRKGADIHRIDVEQCTPLHWAAIKGSYKTVKILLRSGASDVLDNPDVTGMTPVQLAADKAAKVSVFQIHKKLKYRKLVEYLREASHTHIPSYNNGIN